MLSVEAQVVCHLQVRCFFLPLRPGSEHPACLVEWSRVWAVDMQLDVVSNAQSSMLAPEDLPSNRVAGVNWSLMLTWQGSYSAQHTPQVLCHFPS